MKRHFRHFNARETLQAADAYKQFVNDGGKMVVAMAGAMSTAELGISLASMIRKDQVHAISCTAANLEEDIFNATAQKDYQLATNYRDLSPADEIKLRDEGMNRVTDTCIPETAIRHIESIFFELCVENANNQASMYPYEVFYEGFNRNLIQPYFQIPTEDSWLYAAWQKQIPVFTPGFEDSTLGNIFAARVIDGTLPNHDCLHHGTRQMEHLVNWYQETDVDSPIGFFQIGGGIAGDFAICAVPLILQDLEKDCRYWQYFAQIGDSTTSYGSYSGAVPNEKITWHKLGEDSPKFMINSDASIVAPLIFEYILDDH